MVGAEEPVDQREVDREVLVVECGIIAVVPVVVLRRDEQVFEKSKRDAGVGMDGDRLQGNDCHVSVKHRHGEAQYVERNVRERPRDEDIHEVQPRAGEPVDLPN